MNESRDLDAEILVDLGLDESSEEEDLPGPGQEARGGNLKHSIVEVLEEHEAAEVTKARTGEADLDDREELWAIEEPVKALPEGTQVLRKRLARWTDPLTLPRSRTECAKWATGSWPWGGGWKVCVGHKYQWQHMECTLDLIVTAPNITMEDVERALKNAAVAAMLAALLAAMTAGAGAAAAEKAFIAAFVSSLGADAIIDLKQSCNWGKWK